MTLRIGLLRVILIASLFFNVSVSPSISIGARVDNQDYRVFLPFVVETNPSPEPAKPSWGSPIAVSPADGSVWSVNPDSSSVSVLNTTTLTKTAEIDVGGEPWSLAIASTGVQVFVVDRAGGKLVVLNAQTRVVQGKLDVGPEPIAVALNPSGTLAYVSISSDNQLAVVDTARMTVTQRIAIAGMPYAVATDGERIYVTHVFAQQRAGGQEATDDGREGRVSVIDAHTYQVIKQIVLAPNANGFPNLLTGIALTARWVWVPHVRAAPALPNGLTTTVFAAVASIDRATQTEDAAARLLLNDADVFGSPINNPVAAVPSPDGKTLYVVAAGSDLIEVIDVSDAHQPRLVKFVPAGQNPRGIAISPDGKRGYVMSYLSRSISIIDLDKLTQIGDVPTTREPLNDAVLRGKILFNTTRDPRMTGGGWVSCASCHLDGGTDSVTWIFPDGPRQTPPMWNATKTLPWHWSAALDEPHDVEDTIQRIQHGVGLAPGVDSELLGRPNAGRSVDLDALATFMTYGIRPPAPAFNPGDATAGRGLFVASGCAVCHGGSNWTVSATGQPAGTLDADGNGMVDASLRDVGTHNPSDIRGATGFDVPSLLNVGLTAPYLHDGSMPTLSALLRSGHPVLGGTTGRLSENDIANVVVFLNSVGPQTEPIAHAQ